MHFNNQLKWDIFDIPLCRPSKQYLTRRPTMSFGSLLDNGMIKKHRNVLCPFGECRRQLQERLRPERRVSGDRNAFFLGHGDKSALYQVRVVLYLQAGDWLARIGEDVVEELGGEVAHSDGPANTLVHKLFQSLPCLHYGDFIGLHNLVLLIHPPSLQELDFAFMLSIAWKSYWVSNYLRVDVLQRNREMDQVKINVIQSPCISLCICHFLGLVSSAVSARSLLEDWSSHVLVVVVIP